MKLKLDEWRRVRNFSQEFMANACGVHVNTYRRWEENPGEIKFDKALIIVDTLNISLNDLILPSNTNENSKIEE